MGASGPLRGAIAADIISRFAFRKNSSRPSHDQTGEVSPVREAWRCTSSVRGNERTYTSFGPFSSAQRPRPALVGTWYYAGNSRMMRMS